MRTRRASLPPIAFLADPRKCLEMGMRNGDLETTQQSASRTSAAIEHAIGYLIDRRDKRGWWTDFDTLAGSGTVWVSAFVGLALAQTNRAAALAAARDLWARLRWHRWWSPGWGFNRTVPSDADTTIWALHLAGVLQARASR